MKKFRSNLPRTLLLARHGESEWNASRQGLRSWQPEDEHKADHDFELTKAGKLQASFYLRATLSEYGQNWDEVYTSAMPRAHMTGRLALPTHANLIQKTPGLNEHNWGFQHRRNIINSNGDSGWLDVYRQDILDVAPAGATTLRNFKEQQVAPTIAKLVGVEAPGKNIAVFSHGETTIAALWSLLELEDDVVRGMKILPNVNGVVLSSVEPETGQQTDSFKYARRLNPLTEEQNIGDWHELSEQDNILKVVDSRS